MPFHYSITPLLHHSSIPASAPASSACRLLFSRECLCVTYSAHDATLREVALA